MNFEKNEIHPQPNPVKQDKGGESGSQTNQLHSANNFDGPIENRECRDVIFLILLILVLGGLGYITWKAVNLGNPLRIVYGTDSWGNICNQDNDVIDGVNINRTGLDMSSKKYLFYFNQNYFDYIINSADQGSIKICVKACPTTALSTVDDMKLLDTNKSINLCVYDIAVSNYFNGNVDGLSNCPPLPIEPHDPFLFHCIPSTISKKIDHVTDAIQSLFDVVDDNFIEKAASDIQNSWFEIALLCGLSIVVGILLTVVLQLLAPIIVWVMTLIMVLGTLTATGVCWYQYHKTKKEYDKTPESERTTKMKNSVRDWLIGSICITTITVIVLLIFLAVRKHLKLVVQLFKEAGRCIRDIPSLLLHPFITIVILCGVFGALLLIFLYIETAGNPGRASTKANVAVDSDMTEQEAWFNVQEIAGENVIDKSTGFVTYCLEDTMKFYKWYHIFTVIWVVQFILACHQMAIAGAVASWFFTRDKSKLSFPVLNSIRRLIRYHLGSLAFGSLVITIVVFVRMVLSFIENRIKGRTHPFAVYLLKCLKCCLWCFEKFLKFLNSNAYIEISIHGYSFCKAARQAFKVVLNNVIKLAVINYVGDFVLFLGKVATVAIVTVVGIELLNSRSSINYVWLPVTVSAVFAYFISSCFMSVYEMTMDTIFICFCEDSIMNDGVDKPYFMSVNLMRCLSARHRPPSRNKVGPAPNDS